jgi:hypothetical protein
MKHILLLFTISFILQNCDSTTPIYKTKNFQEIASTHKTIAILPPKVIIEIKSVNEADAIRKQEKLESERFQTALANYLNEQSAKNHIFVDIQNPEDSNKILSENGIISLTNKSYKDLAELLNVDAVITSRISLSKPLTNAEAFFTGLLTGYFVPSKVTTVDLSLTDKVSGKMFWNYNWETGGTFISSEKLTNSLMKSAAIRFPYKTKNFK